VGVFCRGPGLIGMYSWDFSAQIEVDRREDEVVFDRGGRDLCRTLDIVAPVSRREENS
jgi:hypothetical protein